MSLIEFVKTPWFRRLVDVVVLGASILFLGFALYTQASTVKDYFTSPGIVTKVVVSGLAHGMSLLFICIAWRHLLRGWSGRTLDIRDALVTYATSNLMKYLPSNVLHVVGRYAATRRRGYSHDAITWSIAGEVILILLVAILLSLWFVFPLFAQFAAGFARWQYIAVIAGVAALALGTAVFLRAQLQALGTWPGSRSLASSVVLALACYVAFFLVNTVLLQVLIGTPLADMGRNFLSLTGVLAFAFTAGLLTPGAPAGLGVREAALLAGLQWTGYSGDALGAALAFRLVTLIGEGALGLFAIALRPKQSQATDHV